MTVTFKQTVLKPSLGGLGELQGDFETQYQSIKAYKASPVKEKVQSDEGHYFRLYLTHSEQKPINWEWYDSSVYIKENEEEVFLSYLKNMGKIKKDCGATGFKIVCIGLDALNVDVPPEFVPEWCTEVWAPSQKTFVNGPKKTSFPKKASGHF